MRVTLWFTSINRSFVVWEDACLAECVTAQARAIESNPSGLPDPSTLGHSQRRTLQPKRAFADLLLLGQDFVKLGNLSGRLSTMRSHLTSRARLHGAALALPVD